MRESTTAPLRWSTLALLAASGISAVGGFLVAREFRSAPAPASTVRSSPVIPPHPGTDIAEASGGQGSRPVTETGAVDRADGPRNLRSKLAHAETLMELARSDPKHALSLALAESNWSWRADFRDAVLRGWAERDSEGAATWVLTLNEGDRSRAMTAVLEGAASQPERVAALVARMSDLDTPRASEYGDALIGVLGQRGAFDVAARFAAERPPSPLRVEQLETAYAAWAKNFPEAAASAAASLSDPESRAAATRGLAVGWSQADAVAAANYAAQLPPGEVRGQMLANAIPRWVERDPVAAAQWLGERDAHPDFDMGVVAVATLPTFVKDRPDLAISLAESIADAPLRANTLRNLTVQWAQIDATAAKRFIETSPQFSSEERQSLLEEIRNRPNS